MEGINILATKLVLDYGVVSLWWLIVGIIGVCIGLLSLCDGLDFGIFPMVIGSIITAIVLFVMLLPVEAHIATIEDNVPYKYIEEHYKIKDKNGDLYTLIPLEEEK